jgi:hypothetical protein
MTWLKNKDTTVAEAFSAHTETLWPYKWNPEITWGGV